MSSRALSAILLYGGDHLKLGGIMFIEVEIMAMVVLGAIFYALAVRNK